MNVSSLLISLLSTRIFLKFVKDTWQLTDINGTHMFRLCEKFKALKPALRSLSRTNYGNFHHKVEQARETLLLLQKEILLSHEKDLILAEHEQSQLLADLEIVEESYLD